MMYPYCFFDGKITRSDKPLVKVNDIAILRGFAAFDFLRIYNGKPFCFEDHMKRFNNTCNLMGIKNKYSNKKIKEILDQLIKKNKQKDYQVRFVLTGGETKNGLEPSTPVFFILFEKFADLSHLLYKKGAKLITYSHQRVLADAKNSNYMQAVLLQKRRYKEKAVEILYIHQDKVLEASTSNIFIIKKGVLYTPKENILKGITRKVIIQIANRLKYKVVEKEITLKELYGADEVFLSATNKKILPIVQVDTHKIGKGLVGGITQVLLKEYQNLITK
jgi:branched-chain amino acid aminotransferase